MIIFKKKIAERQKTIADISQRKKIGKERVKKGYILGI